MTVFDGSTCKVILTSIEGINYAIKDFNLIDKEDGSHDFTINTLPRDDDGEFVIEGTVTIMAPTGEKAEFPLDPKKIKRMLPKEVDADYDEM